MTRRRENDEWTFPDRKQWWLRTHPTLTHLSYSFFTFFPMPRCSVVRPSWVNRNQVIMFHKRSLPKYGLLFFLIFSSKKVESRQWLRMAYRFCIHSCCAESQYIFFQTCMSSYSFHLCGNYIIFHPIISLVMLYFSLWSQCWFATSSVPTSPTTKSQWTLGFLYTIYCCVCLPITCPFTGGQYCPLTIIWIAVVLVVNRSPTVLHERHYQSPPP